MVALEKINNIQTNRIIDMDIDFPYFIYEIEPVDHRWEFLHDYNDAIEIILNSNEYMTEICMRADIDELKSMYESMFTVLKNYSWDGTITTGVKVMITPPEDCEHTLSFSLIFKQSNNGTTYLCSKTLFESLVDSIIMTPR